MSHIGTFSLVFLPPLPLPLQFLLLQFWHFLQTMFPY